MRELWVDWIWDGLLRGRERSKGVSVIVCCGRRSGGTVVVVWIRGTERTRTIRYGTGNELLLLRRWSRGCDSTFYYKIFY